MLQIHIAIVLFTALLFSPCNPVLASQIKPDMHKRINQAAGGLHLPFVENKGQEDDPEVAYTADIFACRVTVSRNGQITYSRLQHQEGDTGLVIREKPMGEDVGIEVTGLDKQTAHISYYHGSDTAKWHTRLPSFGRVAMGRVAPGIRMELKAHGNNVEKLFYLSPGADPAMIRLAVEGADTLAVKPSGDLELSSSTEAMQFTKPVAYQEIEGRRQPVEVRYRVSKNSYGFEMGSYDRSRELVIDPLVKVFPVTDRGENAFLDVAVDAQGNVYAAGHSAGKLAIFKLDSGLENLLAAVRFGSNARYLGNKIRAIALDRQGNVFVTGGITANDNNFPVTEGCHDADPGPGFIIKEGYVSKFSSDLIMMSSTFIGGDRQDSMYAIAINDHGKVYVAGYSVKSRQNFPVTDGAYNTTPGASNQRIPVISRLDNDLTTVEAGTFLGGEIETNLINKHMRAINLAIDSQGDIWVAGRTYHQFPVTDGCLDPTYNGDGDIFLSKLDGDLTQLLISTHIGGNQMETPTDLLIDRHQGDLYLLGYTYSPNFPIPAGGYDPTHSLVEEDGFVLKLNPSANQILAGTFLGGTDSSQVDDEGDDVPRAMALSADGEQLVVVGRTESKSFPTTPGCLDDILDRFHAASPSRDNSADRDYGDGFISVLSGDLTRLINSTFVGGINTEYLDAVVQNGDDLIVAGMTQSGHQGFPLLNYDGENRFSRVNRAVVMRFTPNDYPPVTPTPSDPPRQAKSGLSGILSLLMQE